VSAAQRRPVPFFYRVEEPSGSGLEKGQIIVERKGYGPVMTRMYASFREDGSPNKVTVFRAVKVPHSEMPAEAVENAIRYLEENR
jgi:hypothetical protein